MEPLVEFEVNGEQVQVRDGGISLLEALRDRLGVVSVKDGCSPQGQCGCCTVLVDGQARVSCVTPLRRVVGRSITTLDGLDVTRRDAWAQAFCDTGASQCGFCTPGIIVRLDATFGDPADDPVDRAAVDRALAAHLCRCTGWQTIVDAVTVYRRDRSTSGAGRPSAPTRDLDAAARRAELEGGARQFVGPAVALGGGGFADDSAPSDALVGVMDHDGAWHVAATMSEARAAAGRVQGRHSTAEVEPPIALPPGEWALALQTGWVEPAYLETDAAWCEPGGEPMGPLANGGAFGSKYGDALGESARRLADQHGVPVRLRWTREDTVRFGPKRPPIAAGLRADGGGVIRVAATPGVADALIAGLGPSASGVEIDEVPLSGPPTSTAIRGAGWVEGAVLRAVLPAVGLGSEERGEMARRGVRVDGADGGWAAVRIGDQGVEVEVDCGDPLDAIVLRSYVIGAVHMALGWVCTEGLTVDGSGEVQDLTIRSFGIVRPADMPRVTVRIGAHRSDAAPVAVSTAVIAATAAVAWLVGDLAPQWPLGRLVFPADVGRR